jgi:hypothetical protein
VAAVVTMAAGGISTAMIGCTSAQIEQEINVILQGTSNILAVAGQTSWAKTLSAAEQALAQAETTWKSGGSVQILIDALDTVEAVTAVIPLTDQYSEFIDVIVAAIETVLPLLDHSKATMTIAASGKVFATPNPHKGRVDNFKSGHAAAKRWNSAVSGHPDLHVAKLKVPW